MCKTQGRKLQRQILMFLMSNQGIHMDHKLTALSHAQARLKAACEEFESACEDYEDHCDGLVFEHAEEKLRMKVKEEKHDLLKAIAESQIALCEVMHAHLRVYHSGNPKHGNPM